ncbi:MAG: MaoC family dehydratase [Planctomycetes bacterium]|nr:MaoC family dehydratase [Planctomycetota bacterium]
MTAARYLEDFQAGESYCSRSVTLDADMIKAFASEFDPQPQHLDEQQAQHGFFGGLVASGWHTAALTIRLIVDSDLGIAGGMIGKELEDFQWYRPVRPGDTLHVEFEVLEVRRLLTRRRQGVLRLKIATLNQHGSPVLTLIANLVVPCRPEGANDSANESPA